MGTDKGNYVIESADVQITGSIERKPLTVSLQPNSVISKVYDGNTNISTQDYSLQGVLETQEVSVGVVAAAYADKNVGTGKPVIITSVTLAGADKNDYTVDPTSVEITGDITPKPLTVLLLSESNVKKVYDGGTAVRVDSIYYEVPGVIEGEKIWIGGNGNFDNRHAGHNKTITFDAVELNGPDKGNYTIDFADVRLTGIITPKPLSATLEANSFSTKIYDGSTDVSLESVIYALPGVISGDEVVVSGPSSGTYDTRDIGSNKSVHVTGLTLSGPNAGNYQLEHDELQAAIGNIIPRELTVTSTPQTKRYGIGDPELTYTVNGILPGDKLTGSLERSIGENVGQYPISIGTLSGENYNIATFVTSNLTITPAPLLITAEDKTRNQGEVNPGFSFGYDEFVNGDDPMDLTTPPVATTSAVSGSPAGDYDIEVSGATSNNYSISFVKGKLTVLPTNAESRKVTVSSANRNAVKINIYSDTPQRAAIILYSSTGQPLVVQQKDLSVGNNSCTLPVNNLSAASYTIRVKAKKFNNAQTVNVR